jgi:hypothetical protein
MKTIHSVFLINVLASVGTAEPAVRKRVASADAVKDFPPRTSRKKKPNNASNNNNRTMNGSTMTVVSYNNTEGMIVGGT